MCSVSPPLDVPTDVSLVIYLHGIIYTACMPEVSKLPSPDDQSHVVALVLLSIFFWVWIVSFRMDVFSSKYSPGNFFFLRRWIIFYFISLLFNSLSSFAEHLDCFHFVEFVSDEQWGTQTSKNLCSRFWRLVYREE